MLKLRHTIPVNYKSRMVYGTVIGVDSYKLESYSGKVVQWKSYTLISSLKEPLDRFWITDWKNDGLILWTSTPSFRQKGKLLLDKSGIASISFKGDQGASTPTAAMAVFQTTKGNYLAVEKFGGSQAFFFRGTHILPP